MTDPVRQLQQLLHQVAESAYSDSMAGLLPIFASVPAAPSPAAIVEQGKSWCVGCEEIRATDSMRWVEGEWLCEYCRTIVCRHDRRPSSFCRQCREDYLATGGPKMIGLPRAVWRRRAPTR